MFGHTVDTSQCEEKSESFFKKIPERGLNLPKTKTAFSVYAQRMHLLLRTVVGLGGVNGEGVSQQ